MQRQKQKHREFDIFGRMPLLSLMPLFSKENARSNALKGVETRRKRAAERKAMAAHPPILTNAQAVTVIDGEDSDARARRQTIELQIDAVDRLLAKSSDAKDWHMLTTAKSRLINDWRIFKGIPLPGSRRPKDAKPTSKPKLGPID